MISGNVKITTDPLRRKITSSSSFAKCSSVSFKPLYSLKSFQETLNSCPLKRWLYNIKPANKCHNYTSVYNRKVFIYLFASDLFGSTTKIAFLKISQPNCMKIIYGTLDETLRPNCLVEMSVTEQTSDLPWGELMSFNIKTFAHDNRLNKVKYIQDIFAFAFLNDAVLAKEDDLFERITLEINLFLYIQRNKTLCWIFTDS